MSAVALLGYVAQVNPPLDPACLAEEEVAFLPMAGVDETRSIATPIERRTPDEVRKGYTPFRSGDVLVAKITPCFENGKVAQVRTATAFGFGSTEFHVVRPNDQLLDARYLVHFLRQPSIRVAGERRMTGSAGQRRVPQHFLEELAIPTPPLAEQRRIAAILDQADALRAKRRAATSKLDGLVQSLFVETFGQPTKLADRWPACSIGDLATSISYGTSEKASSSGAVPILRMNNLTSDGRIDLGDLKYVDFDGVLLERFGVVPGDLLFNRTNSAELVGKTAVYRGPVPMTFAGYLVRVRFQEPGTAEYVSAFLNSAVGKKILRGMCKSIVGMANINATELAGIGIAEPPPALRSRFADLVAGVERRRSAMGVAGERLDALFASLQHRAFRGEL